MPSAEAPSAAEQTSHEPEHEELQQTPSTQLPEAHSRHWPWRQSAPAVGLQVPPRVFCARQVPLAPQKYPEAQSASALQLAGHVGDVPLHT